jgi:hypothetical protein
MSNTSQFDVGTAALEHLELLNCSNQNPLEIAAQFRTLLRSKKAHSSNIDYTYTDYILADATIRRRERSCSLADHRSKLLGKIQYELDEDQSSSSKYQNRNSSIEDMYPDSAISSDSSNQNISSNRFQYPTINWKQLREKQHEHKLNKVKQFISTKFQTIRLSRVEPTNLSISSLTNVSDKTESCTYSNLSELRKSTSMENSSSQSRLSSSVTSIRTPSISPSNSPRPTYTISRLNSTLMNHNNEDILFPIADCNLVIKHKVNGRTKRISHFESSYNENELFCGNTEQTVYI